MSDSFFEEKDGLVTEEAILKSIGFHGTDNFTRDCFHPYDVFLQEKKKRANPFLEIMTILHRHNNNIKIVYLNVNCVAGLKCFEVKSLILEGAFDVLALAETKIGGASPDSQFYITGYKMFRKGLNRF